MLADATVAAPPVALELDLDVFDGPFDLLVTLILKDEIDIWEVRVSRIIAEYVLKLADSGEFDLDATSQFVVLVAALLEMKSRLLLEEDVEEELEDLDPDEAAERLLERLVRYSQFKNVAGALRRRWDEHSARLYRSVPVPPALLRRRHRDAAIQPRAVLVPAPAQGAGDVLELAVAHQAFEEALGGLVGVEVLELLLDILLQKQARFHLEQRRDQHHELRGRVEVELAAVRKLQDVLGDDARDAYLPDVDLVLEDQRDEQVERPVEHVEVELERDGRSGDGGVSEHRRRLLEKSSAA